jgi:cell division protein FtsL
MNAAARLVHQGSLTRHLVLTHLLTRKQIIMLSLVMMMALSALSIIYITHLSRMMFTTYERNIIEQDRLKVQHSQLLLERSTWMMQGRTQQIAERKLEMQVPEQQSVVVIHE